MLVASHRSFVAFYRKHYQGRLPWWQYHGAIALLRVGYVARLLIHDVRRMLGRA